MGQVPEHPHSTAILSAKQLGSQVSLFLTDGMSVALAETLSLEDLKSNSTSSRVFAALLKVKAYAINLQITENLDDIEWERLMLSTTVALGDRFAVSRFIIDPQHGSADGDSSRLTFADPPLHLVRFEANSPQWRLRKPRSIRCDVLEIASRELAKQPVDYLVKILDALSAKPLLVIIHAFDQVLSPSHKRIVSDYSSAFLIYQHPVGLSDLLETNRLANVICQAWLIGSKLSEVVRQVLTADQMRAVRVYGDCVRASAHLQSSQAVLPFPATAPLPEWRDQNVRTVTAMSFDLIGSTQLMAQLGIERYSLLLADFHTTCKDIIVMHSGRPDDPQGDDGVMAYFGYPVAIEGAARKAVAAGLEMTSAVQALGLQVRVGIAVGRVAVRAGQLAGLSVHLAARLQSIAQSNTVLISSETESLVRTFFECEPLQEAKQLKGFDGLSQVYLVNIKKGASRDSRLSSVSKRHPFIGRKQELAELLDAFALMNKAAQQKNDLKNSRANVSYRGVSKPAEIGSGSMTLLVGEAGIGKSRLIAEFRRTLAASGVPFFIVNGDQDQKMSPFRPLIESLRNLIIQQGLTVKTLCPPALLEFDPLAQQLLAHLLDPLTNAVEKLTPELVRERTFELLTRWMTIAAESKPYCILIDDAHWLDPSTLELIDRLMSSIRQSGVMIVVAIRSESDPGWRPEANHNVIELSRLNTAQALEFVNSDPTTSSLPAFEREQLVGQAEGVPLFLEESIKMMAARAGAGFAGPDLNRQVLSIPGSIEELLLARLDQVGVAKQLAQVAAVAGREFSRSLIEQILIEMNDSAGVRDLDRRLQELLKSGLIVKVDSEGHSFYRFKHGLIRDTAYHCLWENDRVTLHGATASVLAKSFSALVSDQPELLANHLTLAQQPLEAVLVWERAAKIASSRSAQLEAIQFLNRALSVVDGLPAGVVRNSAELRVQMNLAARYIATEGYGAGQVKSTYDRAAELAEMIGDETALRKVNLGLESFHFMRAEFDKALSLLSDTDAQHNIEAAPWDRLQTLWAKASIYWYQGKTALACDLMNQCIDSYSVALHRQGAVQDPAVMCLCYSAWAYWEFGDDAQAQMRLDQALATAKLLNHSFSLTIAYGFRATIDFFNGAYSNALQHANAAYKTSRDGSFRVWRAHSQIIKGRCMAELGDVELGMAEMDAGYTEWVNTGAELTKPFYLALRGESLSLANRPVDGASLIDQALRLIDSNGERYYEAELLRLRAVNSSTATHQKISLLTKARDVAMSQKKTRYALRSAMAICQLQPATQRNADDFRALEQLINAGGAGMEWDAAKNMLKQVNRIEDKQWQ